MGEMGVGGAGGGGEREDKEVSDRMPNKTQQCLSTIYVTLHKPPTIEHPCQEDQERIVFCLNNGSDFSKFCNGPEPRRSVTLTGEGGCERVTEGGGGGGGGLGRGDGGGGGGGGVSCDDGGDGSGGNGLVMMM